MFGILVGAAKELEVRADPGPCWMAGTAGGRGCRRRRTGWQTT